MNWLKASASQQGRAMMAGLLDPLDQTEAYLAAAAAHPDGGRIYTRMTAARARAEAVAAHDRGRADLRRGILDGVAISWKDNIDSAGTATEAGSRLLEGRVPTRDAESLARASRAGMICLGKTHMTELAFSGLGLNPSTATPPNALDPALVPGGSSSGAAVSVAMGLAAAAMGTDTGGSIRVPAAWNDLAGFKPSHGVHPSAGVVPLCRRFDVIGPIARSIEDCAGIVSVLTGQPVVDLKGTSAAGLRLMVLDGVPYEDAEDAPIAGFNDALQRLGTKGAVITHGNHKVIARAMSLAPVLFAAEAYGIWSAQIEDAPELMWQPILDRFRGGASVQAHEYVAGWESLARLRREWSAKTAFFDAVVLPTVPILPPDAQRLTHDQAEFARANLLTLRNTRIANLLDLPAVTLPTGRSGCGFMLMGHSGGDRHLLRVASAVEAALAIG